MFAIYRVDSKLIACFIPLHNVARSFKGRRALLPVSMNSGHSCPLQVAHLGQKWPSHDEYFEPS